jgi:hypothetical protein
MASKHWKERLQKLLSDISGGWKLLFFISILFLISCKF